MPHCPNCDEMVTPTFVRVFGDNDDRINGCVHCLTSAELTDGDDETPYLQSLF